MAKADTRALWGPTCPHCLTAFRRRRTWLSGDGASCRVCCCRVEALAGRGGAQVTFMFQWSGPALDPTEDTAMAEPGTTNDDTPFQPGERVRWKHYTATVLTNEGERGRVSIDRWGERYWWWNDEPGVRRVKS